MKTRNVLIGLLLALTTICSQPISIGINHQVTPIVSVDILSERISIDFGCNYNNLSSKRSSFDSTWTVQPGNTYEYSFESMWDYSVKIISPSAKLRYSFLSDTHTHPYLYFSMIQPIVLVNITSYTKSSSGLFSDNSDERKKELKSAYGGKTYSGGVGITSQINNKIKLLFDFGYFHQSSGYEESESNGNASSGELSRTDYSNSRSGFNSSIAILYVF